MTNSAPKILVTGCAGFIGSNVTRLLLDDGFSVLGVDNLNDYYDKSLKLRRLESLQTSKAFEFSLLDIENQIDVQQIFNAHKFSAVVNLAARAGVRLSLEDPQLYLRTNVIGSTNLLEAMKTHGVNKYVLASSSSLYAGQQPPFVESMPVNEPISPYAASKKAAEVMAYTYHHLYTMDVSVLRFFTVYGPAGRPDMSYFRFVKWIDQGQPIRIFGDGEQSRDFTYVDDIARGTVAALQPTGFEIFNLGGAKQPISINQMIEILETQLGKKAVIEYQPQNKADMKCTWADASKAKCST